LTKNFSLFLFLLFFCFVCCLFFIFILCDFYFGVFFVIFLSCFLIYAKSPIFKFDPKIERNFYELKRQRALRTASESSMVGGEEAQSQTR